MTGLYVATNVSSLVAQNHLRKNISELTGILERLSTGLRINSGKDDPAGMIASELLKSDITATNKAISNTQRANNVIAIADSALGQINNLLIDIKGLVVEGANTGAMNADQIAANQLQIDASLDAIDRVAKMTNYQGQSLLDGSMDFDTSGVDRSAVKTLNIYQANFGTQSQVDVNINVLQDSDEARLYYEKSGVSEEIVIQVSGNSGIEIFRFPAGTSVTDIAQAINQASDSTGVQAIVGNDATYGQILITSAGFDNDINIRSLISGAAGGNYTFKFTAGNTEETTYTITEPIGNEPGIIEFKLKMQPATAAYVENLDESYNGIYTYDLTGDPNGGGLVVETSNGSVINSTEYVPMNAAAPVGQPTVSITYNSGNGKLQIHYATNATDADLIRAINSIEGFRYISGDTADLTTGTISSQDLRAQNAIDIKANVAGSKFENTDIVYYKSATANPVELSYVDNAQSAAATIRWTDGTQMRLNAKTAGADLNDVKIVFIQNGTYAPGQVTATYNEDEKILYVEGQVDNAVVANNASYAAIKTAIEAASPFQVAVTDAAGDSIALSTTVNSGLVSGAGLVAGYSTTPNTADNSYIVTGQIYGDIGTSNQTVFIGVSAAATANDVVAAFSDPANGSIAANFDAKVSYDSGGTGLIFDPVFDANVRVRVFSGALTGSSDGWTTDVTAQELVDLINCDSVLSKLFMADVALGNSGAGYLTLFEEVAYYGDINAETALQFLGPAGSPDIIFVTDGPNSELGLSFADASLTGCSTSTIPIASLLAQNANAAFTVQAAVTGGAYDNMAVRLIRLNDNYSTDDSYAQYKSGPSNAMAYCSILDDNTTETAAERGKFIVYGREGGTQLNNVAIVAKLDENQAERVKVQYNELSGELIISVNSSAEAGPNAIALTEIVAAINASSEFYAEYDFSYNNSANESNGPGNATIGSLFSGNTTRVEIGNTGETGGYNGVLEVYVGGDDDEITAQRAIDAINNDPITGSLFNAQAIGTGAVAGTGLINFRKDNIGESIDACGNTVKKMNFVTHIEGSTPYANGYMIVHLATDENGNSITTAADLVDFLNSLTAEQTRGISVSLVRPPGVDNLLRTWTVDDCGNIIMSQECDDNWGRGILQPTMEVDDCDNVTYYPIEFFSYGEDIVAGHANGLMVAVNGVDASLRIYAKNKGEEYDGVSLKYSLLTDTETQPYTEYDPTCKEITVYVRENTTAATVKVLLESSEATKNLFRAELVGNGEGIVTVADNYLDLQNGLYDAGYRGGAHMLGAADADAYRLIIESLLEGSSQYVTVKAVSGNFELKDENGKTAETAYGTDMIATLNGVKMNADGSNLSINSSTLQLEISLADKVTAGDSIVFSITGGGAIFQIGPEVVSSQQIRVGIPSVSTAMLGGLSGKLYQLQSGGAADLVTNAALADKIVNEAISTISILRGRLGALQRGTLDPTITMLQDSVESLTEVEAEISNADFAEETSRLTRAQILVQAGAQVLSIANQIPQYATMLLG